MAGAPPLPGVATHGMPPELAIKMMRSAPASAGPDICGVDGSQANPAGPARSARPPIAIRVMPRVPFLIPLHRGTSDAVA